MPIFEYKCNKCDCDFEQIVSSSVAVVTCESCGSKDVKKKMSLFGVSGTEKHVHSGGDCGGCHKSSCSTC